MADGGVPPASSGAGLAGIITAIGGLVTAAFVGATALYEAIRRNRRSAREAREDDADLIAKVARAVVLAQHEAESESDDCPPRDGRRATTKRRRTK